MKSPSAAPVASTGPSPIAKGAAAAPGKPPVPQVRLLVCAMEKKSKSKPMNEILGRLDKRIQIEVMDESTILNDPPESWPDCDALVAFYSHGFPLAKVG